jgi:hypothetical protein
VVERTQKERGHRNFRLTQREKKGSRVWEATSPQYYTIVPAVEVSGLRSVSKSPQNLETDVGLRGLRVVLQRVSKTHYSWYCTVCLTDFNVTGMKQPLDQ